MVRIVGAGVIPAIRRVGLKLQSAGNPLGVRQYRVILPAGYILMYCHRIIALVEVNNVVFRRRGRRRRGVQPIPVAAGVLRQTFKVICQRPYRLIFHVVRINLDIFAVSQQPADFADYPCIAMPRAVLDSSLQQKIIVIGRCEK